MALRAVTDVGGVTHLVTDAAMAAGRRAGIYSAVCGDPVLAASLAAPESGRCAGHRSGTGWCLVSRLLDAEFLEATVLRRTRRGGMAQRDGQCLYRGRPMPEGALRSPWPVLPGSPSWAGGRAMAEPTG